MPSGAGTRSSWPEQLIWAEAGDLRRLFNPLDLPGRVKRGEVIETLWKDSHLRNPQQEPWCTRTQMVLYSAPGGTPIALAHQYFRPDGSLGAAGLPDPKRLVYGSFTLTTRGEYRKRGAQDGWHFSPDCPEWPRGSRDSYETVTRPPGRRASLCDGCCAARDAGLARPPNAS